MIRTRKAQGFSLVELLVAVIVIGLLAAVAMPNFVSAMQKAESASVKSSMRLVQVSVENYLCHTESGYPLDCSNGPQGCGPFFENGSNSIGGQNGVYPVNTVTGAQGVMPVALGISSVETMLSMRAESSGRAFAGGPGNVSYDQLDGGNAYAICGGAVGGDFVSGVDGTILVLSSN